MGDGAFGRQLLESIGEGVWGAERRFGQGGFVNWLGKKVLFIIQSPITLLGCLCVRLDTCGNIHSFWHLNSL